MAELPAPLVRPGQVLIRTHRSLVSLGTERMLVNFGKAGWLQKARSQPEKVKQVLDKVQTDGLRPTVEAVYRKLSEPLPLGYCNAGEVIAIGRGVANFQIGDRVTSNGAHAEVVSVPENLVAKLPPDLSYEEASFTVMGAIALQGIRLIAPTFGETVVVTGLGLIGLLAVQLLQSMGCQVIGLDVDQDKLDLAKSWGIETINVKNCDPVQRITAMTGQVGCDAVLITANAKENQVISQAARMCRQRGRIVLVGVVGLDIQRSDFYDKELSFQVSCSYGPGRYDVEYEQHGHDYPIGLVRWTENRNFQAILGALANGQLKVKELITEQVDIEDFGEIYHYLGQKKSIASILEYNHQPTASDRTVVIHSKKFAPNQGTLGIIGAGNYTRSVILPTLKKLGAPIKYIASAGGLSGTTAAKKFGVGVSVTDYRLILEDPEVDAVLITTRHDSHADLVVKCLEAGKHVFVEKPLAITSAGLKSIENAYWESTKSLTVGFNRRFSPHAQAIQRQLGDDAGPINIVATINAGHIPADSWVHDMRSGGGRIVGEACHLIDLISYFTRSPVQAVVMNAMGPQTPENTDNASLLLRYENGSQGVINYFSNGSKGYAKERIEIYSLGRTAVIDNFRRTTGYDFKRINGGSRQDKGHFEQFRRFHLALTEGSSPIIPYEELINTSKVALAAITSLQRGEWIEI